MHKQRMDQLADGIFAIVMTLLVLDLRVPELFGFVSDSALWYELQKLVPVFLSYVLSFLVLATYWVAHNFIVTSFAHNMTRGLAYLNILFLMTVALIPFSSHLLGQYYFTQAAIIIYSANIVLIGLMLVVIMRYIIHSPSVENAEFSRADVRMGHIRALVPVIAAVIAVGASYWSPVVPLYVLGIAFVFNLIPGTLRLVLRGVTRIAE